MGGLKKEYLMLPQGSDPSSKEESISVLAAALKAFASSERIGQIVITVPEGEAEEARLKLPEELLAALESRLHFVSGGSTRRASVHNALLFLKKFEISHVLIHDGARPWIKKELIEKIIDAAIENGAVIPALPLSETPKEIDGELQNSSKEEVFFIKRHLRRANLCTAQTPQGFRFEELLKAQGLAAAKEAKDHFEYTDDAEVWGEFIAQVAVISGDPANKKITYPEDLN